MIQVLALNLMFGRSKMTSQNEQKKNAFEQKKLGPGLKFNPLVNNNRPLNNWAQETCSCKAFFVGEGGGIRKSIV